MEVGLHLQKVLEGSSIADRMMKGGERDLVGRRNLGRRSWGVFREAAHGQQGSVWIWRVGAQLLIYRRRGRCLRHDLGDEDEVDDLVAFRIVVRAVEGELSMHDLISNIRPPHSPYTQDGRWSMGGVHHFVKEGEVGKEGV